MFPYVLSLPDLLASLDDLASSAVTAFKRIKSFPKADEMSAEMSPSKAHRCDE
jgi:hypothetical protein